MTGVLTLALEAATYVGSVAVLRNADVIADHEVAMRGERSERLMPAVASALGDAGIAVDDLDRVCCGAGPGSFTSLRIAASIAKGIAAARHIPLFARSSLLLMAEAGEPPLTPGRYLALLDALRGELFCSKVVVNDVGVASECGRLLRIGMAHAAELARSDGATTLGDGGVVAAEPRARGFARAIAAHALGAPVDVGTWEPEYGRAAEAQVRWEAAHGRALPGS